MTMILTNKSLEKEKQAIQYKELLADEHHQLALDKAMLLDFVHLVVANKQRSGGYSNDRDELRIKAGKVLSELNL
tara:strand:+ start:504 stop:728 length:225 start_codon:yes stop_codon:yes gene_type:complete